MGTWTSNDDNTEVYYTYTYDMSDDGVDNPTEFKDIFKYDNTQENNIGIWIRSEWSNSTDDTSGSYSSTTADDGSYTTTETWSDGTNTSTWTYNYNSEGTFTGGTSIDNGETTTYDSNWNIVSQTADTTGLSTLTADDGMAYELFGAAKYAETGNWSDDWGTSTEYTYYDENGNKVGTSNTSTYSWDDGNGNIIHSTSTSYNTVDADGNWQFLASEWSDDQGNSGTSVNTYDSESNLVREDGTRTNSYYNGQEDITRTVDFTTTYNSDQTSITEETWIEKNTSDVTRSTGTNTIYNDANHQRISEDGTRTYIFDNNTPDDTSDDIATYNHYATIYNYDADGNTLLNFTTIDTKVDNFTDNNILSVSIRTDKMVQTSDTSWTSERIAESGVKTYDDNGTTRYDSYVNTYDDNGNILYFTTVSTTYPSDAIVTINQDGTITAVDNNSNSVSPETTTESIVADMSNGNTTPLDASIGDISFMDWNNTVSFDYSIVGFGIGDTFNLDPTKISVTNTTADDGEIELTYAISDTLSGQIHLTGISTDADGSITDYDSFLTAFTS